MKVVPLVGVAVGLVLGSSSPAGAAPRERSFIRVDLPQTSANPGPGIDVDPPSRLLFVNWCDGNCVVGEGGEDARANTSVIIRGTRTIAPFTGSAAVRAQILACVRDAYAPFNIQVVDRDPGLASHWEVIAAGAPSQAGFPQALSGVAPFNCAVIPNAITFAFLNSTPDDVLYNCWTIAQESAHALGLSHEFDGRDYMTYQRNPATKSFVDESLCIGTQGCCQPAWECMCQETMQNSYQKILALFGAASATPPSIRIDLPRADQNVEGGFAISVTSTNADGIRAVEILIDGAAYTSLMASPYAGNGPTTLAVGRHKLTAVQIDSSGAPAAVEVVDFTVGLGEVGAACVDGSTCVSGQCGSSGGEKLCTERCDPAADTCPDGSSCRSDGAGSGLCWPVDAGCGGCSSDPGDPMLPIGVGLVVAAAVVRRRRRPGTSPQRC